MKKRNKIIFILLFVMILISSISVFASNTIILLGDLNKNGSIDEEEIQVVLDKIAENKQNSKNENNIEVDVNQDGKLDASDALTLMRYKKAKEEGKTDSEWINKLQQEISFELEEEIKISIQSNNAQAQARIKGKNYGKVTYFIEDEDIATVDSKGTIKGKKVGTTLLKVKEAKANLEASCTIIVTEEKMGIQLDKTEGKIDLSKNPEMQLNATLIGKESKITWRSSNQRIATVSETGVVTGIANGEVEITARTQYGVEEKCKIVVETSPTNVMIKNQSSTTLTVNKTVKLDAIIAPDNANIDKAITWESSNPNVAVVNNQGLVQAKGIGTATITVTTANHKNSTCIITVVDNVAPKIKIESSYTGYVITGGSKVTYEINIEEDNLKSFDKSMVQLTGDLKNEAKLQVTGSGKKYTATVTVPNKQGRLGIEVSKGAAIDKSDNKNTRVKYHDMNDYVFTLNETTDENSITATVGVINSFYIKNYEFYLGDTKKIGARTTNEYTYSGLKTGSSYKIKVKVNIYKDKITDNTVSGWLEKEVKVAKNNGLEVHFINVTNNGGGDCIFIKTKNGKTIMIDTATDGTGEYINKVPIIDKYLRKDKKSKDGKNLLTASNGVVKVDYLLLTHGHPDHMSGFEGLTGIQYQKTSPGYRINTNNKINNEKIRYEFGKIILSCNVKRYKEDAETTGSNEQKNKAIYCYAKNTNKLVSVTAGNVLKIDNMILNIFNPYSREDVPSEWLGSFYNKEDEETNGIRGNIEAVSSHGEEVLIANSARNNDSIVTKLICGSRKMLLTGDAEFFTEEILLGIPAKQVSENNKEIKKGLIIHSSNGGKNKDSKTRIGYASLVYDLTHDNSNDNKYKGWTIQKLDKECKLSRLTPKDLSAQVLKKGHHASRNSTSLAFLKAVEPAKIVSTGEIANNSTIECVAAGPDYRIRKYYNKELNWKKNVFGTVTHGSFYISTDNGKKWLYTNPYESAYVNS